MNSDLILFVDDEAAVRTAFARTLQREGLNIELASSPNEAIDFAQKKAYAVIAADYRMPEMNGLELVEKLRHYQPDATYMLVSGECDLDLAVTAVNEHQLSYVIPKPWNTSEIISVLRRSIESHWERSASRSIQNNFVHISRHLEEQQKRVDSAVVRHTVMLTEALLGSIEMRGHESRAHCRRIAAYARLIAERLNLSLGQVDEIEQGALLHDIGNITVPDSLILREPDSLEEHEKTMVQSHSLVGGRLLEGFLHLDVAKQIVQQHHERWDGSGYPAGLRGDDICMGARIVALADTLEELLNPRGTQRIPTFQQARQEIMRMAPIFDPQVLAAFVDIPEERWLEIPKQHPDAQKVNYH